MTIRPWISVGALAFVLGLANCGMSANQSNTSSSFARQDLPQSRLFQFSIRIGSRSWKMILSRVSSHALTLLIQHGQSAGDQPPSDDDASEGQASDEVASDDQDLPAAVDSPPVTEKARKTPRPPTLPNSDPQATPTPPTVSNEPATPENEGSSPPQPPRELDAPLGAPEMTAMLSEDRPAWVGKEPDVKSDTHYLSVCGIPHRTYEESRRSLDYTLMKAAWDYIDRYVLEEEGQAQWISQVDLDWIKSRWLVTEREYDGEMKLPNGEYRLAWCQLKITERDRSQILEWNRDRTRMDRIQHLFGLSVVSIAGIGVLHLGLGWIVRRKAA